MNELDLRTLLDALNRSDVNFVVIGGVAVAAHGYVRATEDLDVVPEPVAANLKRLAATLVELGATLRLAGERPFTLDRDEAALHRGASVTLDTHHGGLDIVQRVTGVPPFAALEERAVSSELLGVPVRICSLSDLRRMKVARGSTQDEADLERLPED